MRLLKCNVQNFGTLHEAKFDFSDGLTVIKEENGFGKSTLAMFLKAMLYGLPQTTKRSIDENDRKKFLPWQGGTFGGSLEFEANGKQYRVERTFSAREKDDTFRLIDVVSGNESRDFSSNLGVELFGVDAESFQRSVFVPQVEMSTEMNNDMQTKLTGLLESSDDLGNYDDAVDVLEKRMKFYSISNGKKGEIADITRAIEETEAKLRDAVAADVSFRSLNADLNDLKAQAEELNKKKADLRVKITAASDAAALAEQAKKRAELRETVRSAGEKLSEIGKRYPTGMPTEQELQRVTEKLNELKSVDARLSTYTSDNADRNELQKLNEFFSGGVPTEGELSEIKASVARLAQLKIKAEAIKPALNEVEEKTTESNGRSSKWLLIAAVLVLAVGAAALIWQTAVGIALLVLGLVGLGAAGFIYLKNMIASGQKPSDNTDTKKEYESLVAEAEGLAVLVGDFTKRFMPEEAPEAALETVSQALRDLNRVKTAVATLDEKITEAREQKGELLADLGAFFAAFGVGLEGEYADRLVQIRRDSDETGRLNETLESAKQKLKEIPEAPEKEMDAELLDRDALLAEEREVQNELDTVQAKIVELEKATERLLGLSQERTSLEEQLDGLRDRHIEATQRYEVLTTTLKLLEAAKTDLSLRYLDRVTGNFKKYLTTLQMDSEDCLVDTELHVQLDRGGKARERNYFSRGMRDVIDIAMRLSLGDALFESGEAVLILDDPFVNLDDDRLKKAMGLLKKLAEDRQIIYLTCHSSRC